MRRAPGVAMLAFAAAAAAAACAAGGAGGGDHPHGPQAGGGLPSKAVENSVPYVGGGAPAGAAAGGGRGITVAVIDTGVDSFHPDFAGGSAAGGSRVVGSRNLLGAGPAFDADGHGTGVAGIIAAGGALRGMAPLSEIVSYKVSGDGLSVSPDLIIRAVRGAVADGADVVNISLGVNRTNEDIDAEVNRAVASGVVVVAAAGNDGPGAGTIGSPGRNPNVITVGATYNNVTAGLVAAVEHGGSTYGAVPMVGAPEPEEPVAGRIVFAGHATAADMARAGGEAAGSIVLAERGGGEGGALVYFSDKERNAAAAGAAALVVYNDEPGMFFGELVHEHNPGGYAPSIPTVSMSREDGLELRAAAEQGGEEGAVLEVRKSPDFVAGFSSRGPVSPFYPKPDLVAPGVFVNTTLNGGGYNVSSGTSFAAPHVAGAAALLLERRPGLEPAAVKSILVTTADAVAGAEGPPRVISGADAAGAGRLNVTRALAADIVFDPPLLDLDVSPARPSGSASIGVARLGGEEVGPLDVSAALPRGLSGSHSVEYDGRGGATVTLEASLGGEGVEDAAGGQGARTLAGSLAVSGGGASYAVPVMVRVSNGSIAAAEVPGGRSGWGGWIGLEEGGGTGGAVEVSVESPDGWSYARVTVTDPRSGAQYHGSSRPGEPALVEVGRNGTHWIEASILVGGRPGGPVAEAFGKVDVEGAAAGRPAGVIPDSAAAPWPRLPEGQAAIVAAAAVAVASAGAAATALARRREAPPPLPPPPPPPPPLQRLPPPPPPPDRALAGERPYAEDRAGARP